MANSYDVEFRAMELANELGRRILTTAGFDGNEELESVEQAANFVMVLADESEKMLSAEANVVAEYARRFVELNEYVNDAKLAGRDGKYPVADLKDSMREIKSVLKSLDMQISVLDRFGDHVGLMVSKTPLRRVLEEQLKEG